MIATSWRAEMKQACNRGTFLILSICASTVWAIPVNGPPGVTNTPEARLTLAATAPCSSAYFMYKDLADDSTAADSLRMIASGKLADAAFTGQDFVTARDYYQKAAQYTRGTGVYRYRAGCAALATGDTAEAQVCFSRVTETDDSDLANNARVKLGELNLARGDYEGAMALFLATGNFSSKNGWSVPAFIGKLTCAKRLGLADSAAAYERLLSLYAKTMLEKERFRCARDLPLGKRGERLLANNGPADPSPAKKGDTAVIDNKTDSTFTLQVGAFGSRERAAELQKRLSKKYGKVTCMPALVSERTFYRVWIGDFATRQEAESFGQTRLMRQGQAYRIVVK